LVRQAGLLEKDFVGLWVCLESMGLSMELRHLRYFVAVAEEGSVTLAAEHRLHTSQPSLSRQLRDLEYEVGADLLIRSAQGVTLTAAGRVFLDNARLALAQVEAAVDAARRAAVPSKPGFALGFLTGQEMDWLPGALNLLKDVMPNIEITVASQYSPDLADALQRKKLDLAFMRPEAGAEDLDYRIVTREPLVVIMPSDHDLAAKQAIEPGELSGQTFINVSKTAPHLRQVIDAFIEKTGIAVVNDHQVDNIAMAMSLVASTRGVALLPAYTRNFMPWSVVSRPLAVEAPTIDLVVGYHRGNNSPTLKLFLSRVGELACNFAMKTP